MMINNSDSGNTKKENENNNVEKVSEQKIIDYGKCEICSDKASGIHYSVTSCEACKASIFQIIFKIDYS